MKRTTKTTQTVDAVEIIPYLITFCGYKIQVKNVLAPARDGERAHRAIGYLCLGAEMPNALVEVFQQAIGTIHGDPFFGPVIALSAPNERPTLEQAALRYFEHAFLEREARDLVVAEVVAGVDDERGAPRGPVH